MAVEFDRDVCCLLGLPFDAIDLSGATKRIREAVETRESCFFSTPNTNFLVACLKNAEFRESVIGSDLSIADGMPLVWISRLLGMPIRHRVAGASLFDSLREPFGKPISVFFFGGPDGAGELACRQLASEKKGLACAGYLAPGFGSIEDMSSIEIIEYINASNADFLVVSLGAGKGQAWIQRNRQELRVPVISHLGAVINFAGGTLDRAPPWMQRAGLEWAWRIKEEPRLWRRYFDDGSVLVRLLLTRVLPHFWLNFRHFPSARQIQSASFEIREETNESVLMLRGPWVRENLPALRSSFRDAVETGKNLHIDLGQVTYVDSAFLGLLILVCSAQKKRRGRMTCGPISPAVRRIFSFSCCEYLLHESGDGKRPA